MALRPVCAALAVYAAVVLAVLLRSALVEGGGWRVWSAIGLHVTAIVGGALAASAARSHVRTPAFAACWCPVVLVPLLYFAVPASAAALQGAAIATAHDRTVINWEHWMFAGLPTHSPTLFAARRWPSTGLSEALHTSYLAFFALLYAPAAVLWRTHRRREFVAVSGALAITLLGCYVVFVAFPVEGPWYTWRDRSAAPAGPVRSLVAAVLEVGASRGAAFPSAHVAVSVAVTVALARVAPALAVPAMVLSGMVCLAVVYSGFHYGVDVVAGAALGGGVGTAAPAVAGRRWLSVRVDGATPDDLRASEV